MQYSQDLKRGKLVGVHSSIYSPIIDLTLVRDRVYNTPVCALPFVYSSFHNLAFVRNIIHQRQQSGCFPLVRPLPPTTAATAAAVPPPDRLFPHRNIRPPTITQWYGWTVFVIYYWIDFSTVWNVLWCVNFVFEAFFFLYTTP